MRPLDHSIIAELEEAVRSGSPQKRVATLRRVTDLFLEGGETFNDQQVSVFDDVLCLLIARVESRARAELGTRLAPLDYAPAEAIKHLAWDREIAVAGSVLRKSCRLTGSDLVAIASTQGQDHLLAISDRSHLPEKVTDVLVHRGERQVIRRLAGNATARFSDAGYGSLVARAEADDELVELIGLRLDLPYRFLRDLLRRATKAVCARLALIAPPERQAEINEALRPITDEEAISFARDYSTAEIQVSSMKQRDELDDAALARFAATGKFEEIVASLAILNRVSTDLMARLMEGPRSDLILIPCKAAGLNWATVEAILSNRQPQQPISVQTLKLAGKDYERMTRQNARRSLRAWQFNNKIDK